MVGCRHRLTVDDLRRSTGLQLLVVGRQQHRTLRVGLVANLTVGDGNVGIHHKVMLISLAQLHPIPIGDRVVQMVGLVVVDNDAVCLCILVGILQRYTLVEIVVVGVEVHLHILEFHLTVRGSIDVQRDLLGLAIGIRHTSIGRDILVVNVTGASDEPVVGGCCTLTHIRIGVGIAVVDDLLHIMHEVTRGLHLLQRRIRSGIGIDLVGNGLGMRGTLLIIR